MVSAESTGPWVLASTPVKGDGKVSPAFHEVARYHSGTRAVCSDQCPAATSWPAPSSFLPPKFTAGFSFPLNLTLKVRCRAGSQQAAEESLVKGLFTKMWAGVRGPRRDGAAPG